MDGDAPTNTRTFTAVFLFAGIGVGALGFVQARVTVNGVQGVIRSLGGVDLDPIACKSFQKLTGSPCHQRDIAKMTGAELRALFGDDPPDVIFLSAPCQGFSGLISNAKGEEAKYRALNELAVRGLELVFEAWGDNGPGLVIFENVPRIATRGEPLLKRIRKLFHTRRYVTHEGVHNCGKIGRLAQSRERFLMVARNSVKVPVFVYQPPVHELRPCSEVIEALPLPGTPSAGRLHRMPAISLRTWLRLAAIRPGKDWRDLSSLDGKMRPAWARYAITPRHEPMGAVAGNGTNSAWGFADVRVGRRPHNGVLGVVAGGEPFGAVTGAPHVTSGSFSFADVRLPSSLYRGAFGVVQGGESFGTITGAIRPSHGPFSFADLRVSPRAHGMHWRVLNGGDNAPCVTGVTDLQAGAPSYADLRVSRAFADAYGVLNPEAPSPLVTGSPDVSNGCNSYPELRLAENPGRHASKYRVNDTSAPSNAITAVDGRVNSGAPCVADLRLRAKANNGCYGVLHLRFPAETITGNAAPGGSACSIADTRVEQDAAVALCETAPTIVAVFDGTATAPMRGATRRRGPTKGLRGGRNALQGAWWTSDPRVPCNPPLAVRWRQTDLDDAPPYVPVIPGRGDGSWHRPITLLERAALQNIPVVIDGQPLDLYGSATTVARHIGNAVPRGGRLGGEVGHPIHRLPQVAVVGEAARGVVAVDAVLHDVAEVARPRGATRDERHDGASRRVGGEVVRVGELEVVRRPVEAHARRPRGRAVGAVGRARRPGGGEGARRAGVRRPCGNERPIGEREGARVVASDHARLRGARREKGAQLRGRVRAARAGGVRARDRVGRVVDHVGHGAGERDRRARVLPPDRPIRPLHRALRDASRQEPVAGRHGGRRGGRALRHVVAVGDEHLGRFERHGIDATATRAFGDADAATRNRNNRLQPQSSAWTILVAILDFVERLRL